ncbi:SLAIN motif-containing protein 1a isoform X2 [Corythoichthys intestinalis]|uniref:SLAIN motif-containing protein 1a isoform X2 n=1 Tax=Corythoichthys intestinalis TaxID=161448 RepID=UPI0025A5C8BB|nr:SLAIN motif-containing protein 1a isoform X2 [Corythoichthys intestinalis]
MDAEVLLGPPVMADVNGNNKLANAELEVLKLQELVRKLEKQNEQLRSRANAVNNCPVASRHQHLLLQSGTPAACLPAAREPFPVKCESQSPREPFAYFQPSSSSSSPDAAEEEVQDGVEEENGASTVLDEVDILDLNTVFSDSEPDSWLYVSSKSKPGSDKVGISPLQWCRQVLDHPGPEVELAKMTLCHRLDQAKRWRGTSPVRPYSCIDGLSTLSCPILPYSKPAAITDTTALPPVPSSPAFPLRPSLSLDRAPSFLSNSGLHSISRRHAAISPQSSLDSEAGISELDDDSITMGYKLQDMTDVEVMARLQEESLRQDYASTSATVSRRCSSFSLNSLRRSNIDLEEDDEDDEDEGYDQLPPPQPRLFRTGSVQRGSLPHSHTFSSFRDCRRSSNASTFSLGALAPYAGVASLSEETQASSYRNSAVPSPGQLSQRVQSIGNFPTAPRHPLKATAYVSPTVLQGPSTLSASTSLHSVPGSTALPQPLKPAVSSVPQPLKTPTVGQSAVPRSSLPRPASFVGLGGALRSNKMTQSTRSLLTPPKSLASLSTLRDASWKDGCY